MNNRLIIVSGMSGSGKTFLINQVLQAVVDLSVVTAVTTRQKHRNEKDSAASKLFISKPTFDELEAEGKLCFVNKVYGYYYAFYKNDIEQKLKKGSVILEYKASMVNAIKARYDNSFAMYIYSHDAEKILHALKERKGGEKRFESDIEERNSILSNPKGISYIDELFENKFDDKSVERFIQRIISIIK